MIGNVRRWRWDLHSKRRPEGIVSDHNGVSDAAPRSGSDFDAGILVRAHDDPWVHLEQIDLTESDLALDVAGALVHVRETATLKVVFLITVHGGELGLGFAVREGRPLRVR